MCDAPAVSREHVPPACFFPESKDSFNGIDLRRNLITVPSCDDHNTKKTKDDEYLWYVIAATAALNDCGQHVVRTKIKRSIERRPALGHSLLSGATPAQVFDPQSGEWRQTLKAHFDGDRFYRELEALGRALYLHHFKRKWLAAVQAFPNFVSFDSASTPLRARRAYRDILRAADRGFTHAVLVGENQEVFFYQVCADDDHTSALIRTTFYGHAEATLAFTPKPMSATT